MIQARPSSIEGFLTSIQEFLYQVAAWMPLGKRTILRYLRRHFRREPNRLPVISEQFSKSDHPNVNLAIEAYLSADKRAARLIGINVGHDFSGVRLSQLAMASRQSPRESPVEYTNITLNDDSVIPCINNGLFLVTDGTDRLAILMRATREIFKNKVELEVMAIERPVAECFLTNLKSLLRKRNVYRGQVISLVSRENALRDNASDVKFHRLAKISREEVVLPAGVLERIERQTIFFSNNREKLLKAGRHLKRGVLLYGPPGTGKTLSAMYLAGQMADRTVVLLTGSSLEMVEESCRMARLLQPSTIILEDADLIAEERTSQKSNILLFELLNQMDGMADDFDVLFILTTNRPDLLEPALAARPGRIDLAIEIPPPDADCRRRLFQLYGQGLKLQVEDLNNIIEKTEGVSAAFIRELLRKAALLAADQEEIVVSDQHLRDALHELVVEGGELTRHLLGTGKAFGQTP